MISAKFEKLSQRTQRYDESVTAYFDDVITLCKEIDPKMQDTTIIQHLMKGINPEFRKELTRRQSSVSTLHEFLQQAKLEQDLHNTFTRLQTMNVQPETVLTHHLSSNQHKRPSYNVSQYGRGYSSQPNSNNPTMNTKSSGESQNSYSTTRQSNATAYQRNYRNTESITPSRNWRTRNQIFTCKVCGKQNHRSINCTYKRSSGCYNCGQQHSVRDCPNPPHFQ